MLASLGNPRWEAFATICCRYCYARAATPPAATQQEKQEQKQRYDSRHYFGLGSSRRPNAGGVTLLE